jgi:hypothetical protein
MDTARKKLAKHMYSFAFTQHKEFVQHHRNTLILQEEMEASPAHSHEVLGSKVIDAAIQLEALSRKMLTDALPMASLGRRILVADRHIQLRDANAVGGGDIVTADDCRKEDEGQPIWEHESLQIGLYLPQDNPSALKDIRKYRDLFAYLLAAASRLQKLEGEEQHRFERWLDYGRDEQRNGEPDGFDDAWSNRV